MKHSIKRFLLFYLLFSITLTSSLTTIGNYFLDNHALERHFDKQLSQTVYFIRTLVGSSDPVYLKSLQASIDHMIEQRGPSFQFGLDRMQFRVWNKQGTLLLETPSAPQFDINKRDFHYGFDTISVDKKAWRVLLSPAQKNSPFIVFIAERYQVRSNLAHELTWGNLFMLLWSYPLFGLLIWLSIDRGLSSLNRLTSSLSNRNTTDFNTVDIHDAPTEVKPLVEALNKLFIRLDETFIRNKRFSADAAHELRTPLAALRAQVQVAERITHEEELKQTLKNIITGVDRCTHIVQQLLTLSRLAPEATLNDIHPFNLSKLATELLAQLAPEAIKKNIEIELTQIPEPPVEITLKANETSIAILIRNLVDNAIRYTPENGQIIVLLKDTGDTIEVIVTDTGPGIPKELRDRVFERFFRILGTKASGSGLGLAIVQQIVELHHATITLETPANGKGVTFRVCFPKNSLT